MVKIRLATGVTYNGISAVITGGGVVAAATATGGVLSLGWAMIALGVSQFAWGVTVDDKHWWAKDRIRMTWPYALILLSVIGLLIGGQRAWINYKSPAKGAAPPTPNAPGTNKVREKSVSVANAPSHDATVASPKPSEPSHAIVAPVTSQAPPSAGVAFWPTVGCAFPEGVVTGVTGLSTASNDDLRQRIREYSQRLRAHEDALRVSQTLALKFQPKLGEDTLAARQNALDQALHNSIAEYQERFKPEADILVKELHIRLARPYPMRTSDGLTVGAFGAVCGGLYYGKTPLSDLADWLTKLGNDLK